MIERFFCLNVQMLASSFSPLVTLESGDWLSTSPSSHGASVPLSPPAAAFLLFSPQPSSSPQGCVGRGWLVCLLNPLQAISFRASLPSFSCFCWLFPTSLPGRSCHRPPSKRDSRKKKLSLKRLRLFTALS